MPWGRVDDDFYDHPKVKNMPAKTRNAACGLYWRAVSYSNRYLTDGKLSEAALIALDARPEEIEALLLIAPGFRAGLFERCRIGYRLHDFLAHNKSRSEVHAERKKKAEAGRLGGLSRARNLAQSKHGASDVPAKQTPSTVLESASSKTLAPGASPRPDPTESESTTPKPPQAGARPRSRRENGENPRANGTSPRQLERGSPEADRRTLQRLGELLPRPEPETIDDWAGET
jgi:hypothetical protein